MRTGGLVVLAFSAALSGCSATHEGADAGTAADASEASHAATLDGSDGAWVTPAFVGIYACTGFQTQSCSAPGSATGTYDLTAACPLTIAQSGASSVAIHYADGVSLEWQVTGPQTATLAGMQSIPGSAPNPEGLPGTISSLAFVTGDLLASSGSLQLQESGNFRWTGDAGGESCQFAQRFMGMLASDAGAD